MPRVSSSVTRKARHSKVLKAAKGYYGARSRCFKTANQAVIKAGQYAYRDRRAKKRTFRGLWIQRVNAAARMCGISYSRLIALVGDQINRGDIIGTVGSTGRSTGPHLDFRINWFQTRLDPMSVLKY